MYYLKELMISSHTLQIYVVFTTINANLHTRIFIFFFEKKNLETIRLATQMYVMHSYEISRESKGARRKVRKGRLGC